MQQDTTVLQVSGLKKRYGSVVAVDGLDLTVRKGEIFGLLGPNGAGKSTTLECILGTRTPDAGSVRILGQAPHEEQRRLFARIGVQFQDANYPGGIRVGELYRMFAVLYEDPLPADELLSRFGLAGLMRQEVATLSGGQRQKLSLALALVNRPELVFLDELTTGLDPAARRHVWQTLRSLRETGLTIILTSHYMDEVDRLCDRILIMDRGRAVVTGTPAAVSKSAGKENLEEAYLAHLGLEACDASYLDAV